MRNLVLSPLVAAAALATGLNAAPVRADTVVCESRDGQTNHCPADTRGGVRLVTQYSKHGCYQGDSWGYDRRSIWVSNGCRAQFQTGETSSEPNDHNHKHAAAAVPGRRAARPIRSFRPGRQLASTPASTIAPRVNDARSRLNR